jgi:iron complex outermembrane receptor protein
VQDVPIPITVLNGDALDREGHYRIDDLQQKLPSTNVGFQNPRQSSIAVRGLGNNPANDGLESSVGVFLDGVYLGRPGMVNFDIIDIDRVELLRGPQGTLFGKNTTAGLLNITTKAPGFEREITGEASYGEYDYYQLRGAISGPLWDRQLAGRVSAYKTERDGFIDNLYNGHRLNGSNRDGARGQLLFKPGKDFSLRFIADWNQEDEPCCVGVLYALGPVQASDAQGRTKYQIQYQKVVDAHAAASGEPVPPLVFDPNGRAISLNGVQSMRVHQGGLSLQADYGFGDGYKLTSISAYRNWYFEPLNGSGLPFVVTRAGGQAVKDQQLTQEIRLASPDGRAFEWVLGAFGYWDRQDNHFYLYYGPDADTWLGTPPSTLSNVASDTFASPQTNSVAAFAQATWHLSEALALTAGVRDTFERKAADIEREAPTGPAPASAPAAAVRSAQLGSFDSFLVRRDNDLSGLLSLSYKPGAGVLLYASAAHGAKSGGINPVAPPAGLDASSLVVEPEKANDLEAGVKSTLFNRRLQLNASVYRTLVKDYQATLFATSSTGVLVQTLSNIPWVRSQGVEGEAAYVFSRKLQINGYLAYNDTRYKSYYNAPCPAEVSLGPATPPPKSCNLTDAAVVGAPPWTAGATVSYSRPLGGAFKGYAIGEYSYRSSFFGSADDSLYGRIPAYGIANLRVGLRYDARIDVSVFARNLFDRHYATTITSGANGGYSATPGDPRVIGGAVRLEF